MASEKNSEEQCGFWASFSGPKNNNTCVGGETSARCPLSSWKGSEPVRHGVADQHRIVSLRSTQTAKGYKWVSLVLVFLFLGAGGFVAWFLMQNAAHKLAGGAKYVRLSGTPASYGTGVQAEQEQGFFASEEELAKADPSLKRELLDTAAATGQAGRGTSRTSASRAGGGGAAGGAADGDISGGSGSGGAASHGSGLENRLSARQGALGGPTKGLPPSKAGGMERAGGAGAASVRSAQSDTDKPGRGGKGGPKPSVLEALKSAFKVNLYGARLASQDSAREWISRTFDANPGSRYSLDYPDEQMKAKLDRMNPDSVPHYLRDQSLDAAGARSLGASDVDKPDFDKDGTKDALKGDKKYQSEKDSQDLAKALFNPLGPFGGGSGGNPADPEDPAGPTGKSWPPSSDDGGNGVYSDPEDEQTLNDIAIEDYVATEGYGAECGCTAEAPCCCLPPNYFDQQCPMYGPFLPDDPCGAGMYDTPPAGDFPPPATDGTMWV